MHYVVTLVEKDFLYGSAVLYNSLVRNGFDGTFLIGLRDTEKLPAKLYQSLREYGKSSGGIEILELDTKEHFTNYKAQFMRQIFAARPAVSKMTYLDPDIVCACPWQWMDTWCEHGPTMCADVNWWMPGEHPTRWVWKRFMRDAGFHSIRSMDYYLNGGFLSLPRSCESFLRCWQLFTDIALRSQGGVPTTGDIGTWRKGGRENMFFTPDQDALNMAAMSWEGEMSIFGPDAMGFAPGIRLVPHALGAAKPWRRKYLGDALRGCPPRLVDKVFWADALSPIPVANPASVRRKQMAISLASAFGRVYRRR